MTGKAPAPPCRLAIIKARRAPRALILRRGPSGWYHLIRWDTDTDAFTHRAWFRGRIYEERDFNGVRPDPQPAPAWARAPLAKRGSREWRHDRRRRR